jgi:5-aminopentanamidase
MAVASNYARRATMSELPIGICQLESEVGTADRDPRPSNLRRAEAAIQAVAADGARLAVFGEAFLNGYASDEYTSRYAVAESDDDVWIARLVQLAKAHDIQLLMGASTFKHVPEERSYNTALLIAPSGLAGVYNKTHLAVYGDGTERLAESEYWHPGDTIPVFETELGRIGVEICYDNAFPEVSRTLALQGAELIVNISAAIRGYEEHWASHIRVRAAENAVWFLHVSVVGTQKTVEFFGGSRLYTPEGDLQFAAPYGEEFVGVVSVDLETRQKNHES